MVSTIDVLTQTPYLQHKESGYYSILSYQSYSDRASLLRSNNIAKVTLQDQSKHHELVMGSKPNMFGSLIWVVWSSVLAESLNVNEVQGSVLIFPKWNFPTQNI